MEYLTTSEMADKWNISTTQVQHLCSQGKIEGAIKMGGYRWLIPKDAEKPKDKRIKENRDE